MDTTLLLPFAVILAVFGGYRVVRDLVRLLRAERSRRTRLRELEAQGGVPGDPVPVSRALDDEVTRSLREDWNVTGVILAGLGVAAVFAGRALGYGQFAVGLYTAGLCGIVIGVALALMGAVMRVISRPLTPDEEEI